MQARARLIDVSHVVEDGMVTYKGFPAPIICDWRSREASRDLYDGAEFQIGRIEMIANTGTYVDSPFHRYADGKDLSELPLESVAGLECLVVPVDIAAAGPAIDTVPLPAREVGGRAILFDTGWDRHWRTEAYFEGHPHLTARAAEWLAKAGAALVGIDSMNIDSIATGQRPVHTILLGRDIPIVEHLCGLASVPRRGGVFSAVPVKVRGCGTFPVRAYVAAKD